MQRPPATARVKCVLALRAAKRVAHLPGGLHVGHALREAVHVLVSLRALHRRARGLRAHLRGARACLTGRAAGLGHPRQHTIRSAPAPGDALRRGSSAPSTGSACGHVALPGGGPARHVQGRLVC